MGQECLEDFMVLAVEAEQTQLRGPTSKERGRGGEEIGA